MKGIAAIFTLLIISILIGCSNGYSNDQQITEERAKEIVIDERSRECCGSVEIISVVSKSETYIIQWEIDSIYEEGTESINKKTGRIKMIESSYGTCRWK